MLKRGVDIALSFLLLVAVLPLLALAAVLIKLDSAGPILFSQPRMGRNFSRFRIWKLRTMRTSQSGLAYTLSEDPRITRTGRCLRLLKVDELPQLWNVLRGEMSLVGPRPIVPELAIEFRHAYRRLLRVRPGLTDPASIKYCRESRLMARMPDQSRYFKTVLVPDKIRISTAYIARANFWSDLVVLLSTAWVLLFGQNQTAPLPAIDTIPRQAPQFNFNPPPMAFKKPPASETSALGAASGFKQA